MTHFIGHIGFDFGAEREAFAHTLYGQWEAFFQGSVERILDEVLERSDTPGYHLEFDRIDLYLGEIPEADFGEQFPIRFREALEQALVAGLSGSPREDVRKIPESDRALEVLTEFLLRGTLSTDRLSAFGGSLASLFRYVVRQCGNELTRFLRSYGHYTGLQERLVYQLDDPELEAGVDLLTPSDSGFICGYTRWLRQKYHTVERPEIPAGQYRHTVWQVVYAYLLNDRGSVFNRKHFLAATVSALAGKLNVEYGELLRMLSDGIAPIRGQTTGLPELLALLDELSRDAARREKEQLELDTAQLYRMLAEVIRQGKMTAESEWFPWLAAILSREESSIFLLRALDEPLIRSLVSVMVPAQAEDVLVYADTLDQEQEQGLFEGKAGGDFSRVKWTAIFAVLGESPGVGFNLLYFVERVLKRLAARYNLPLYELLRFLNRRECLARMDRRLPDIFSRLLSAYSPIRPAKDDPAAPEKQLEEALKDPTAVTGKQRDRLYTLFAREAFRREWLRTHNESDGYRLLDILVPGEAVFLREYLRQLDEAAKDYTLEGRAGGSFGQVKWEFILDTIAAQSGSALTRKYVVRRSLSGLAAHYNLVYVELLLYFLREPSGVSAALRETLTGLLAEEIGPDTNLETGPGTNGSSIVWRAIGSVMPGPDRRFVEEFREWVEHLFRRIAPGDSSILRLFRQAFYKLCMQWITDGILTGGSHFRPENLIREIARRSAAFSPVPPDELIRLWSGRNRGVPLTVNRPTDTEMSATPSDQSIRLKNQETLLNTNVKPRKNKIMEEKNAEPFYPKNAGIVLLSPYLSTLFQRLDYLTDNTRSFRNEESQIRAIFVLQYLVYGEEREYEEYQLVLNKTLTAFPAGQSLPRSIELTEGEKTMAADLMTAAKSNWPKLGSSSVETFRQAFLQRLGKLEEEEDRILLTVEEKAYDLLLDSLPWSFRVIRMPWMEKMLQVHWRE